MEGGLGETSAWAKTGEQIPESTLPAGLKVHEAPGALTNVVRNGRGCGGRDGKTKTGFTGGGLCCSSLFSCLFVVLFVFVFLSF